MDEDTNGNSPMKKFDEKQLLESPNLSPSRQEELIQIQQFEDEFGGTTGKNYPSTSTPKERQSQSNPNQLKDFDAAMEVEESPEVRFPFENKLRSEDDDHAMRMTSTMINKYANFSKSHIAIILKPIVNQLEQKEITISDRESMIFEAAETNKTLKRELSYLQKLSSAAGTVKNQKISGQHGGTKVQIKSSLFAQNDDSMLIARQITEEDNKLVSFLAKIGIKSVTNLQKCFEEMEYKNSQMKQQTNTLQAMHVHRRQLESQLCETKDELRDARYKIRALEEKNEQLIKQLTLIECNEKSNSFSRIGRCQKTDQMLMNNKQPLQTKERISPFGHSSRNTFALPEAGSPGMHFENVNFEKETPREGRESFEYFGRKKEEEEDVFGDNITKTMGYYHKEEDWDMGPHRKSSSYSEIQVVREMIAQQNLPEPPKFNGEDKVSIEGFAKSFALKYGVYSEENQIIILETKFLVGKAQKIFRTLPDRRKRSVREILSEIASVLRVAPEDQYRRAKIKWEALRKKPEQSFEDFCLEIDEGAKYACGRSSPAEVSSFKTTKLFGAITDDTLYTLVDTKLGEVPEHLHYEVCRSLVTRFEVGQKEKRERMKMYANVNDKRKSSQNQMVQNSQNILGFSNEQSMLMNNNSQAAKFTPSSQQNWRMPPNNQFTKSNVNNENNGSTNQTWRSKTIESNMSKQIALPACSECKAQGCHEPTCSHAPEMRRKNALKSVTCFNCNEKGHYSPQCPKTTEKKVDNAVKATGKSSVESISEQHILAVPEKEIPDGEDDKATVRIENGRIGCADVELMLDSGACISLLPSKLWEEIKEKNGSEWVKSVKMEPSKRTHVYTANNEPIKLLSRVTIGTAMQSRTRDLVYHIAVVERDNIILGIDQFEKMGIKVSIEEKPREIRVCQDVRIVPSAAKVVDVQVEGVFKDDETHCLISPLIDCLSTSVCQVDKDGRAMVKLSNFGSKAIILKKGDKIATGELEGFELIQDKAVAHETIGNYLQSLGLEESTELVSSINDTPSEERWNTVCEHLKKPSEINGSENEIWKVVQDFQNIFAIDDSELGRTNVVTCDIELKEDTKPIRQRPRPIPLAVRQEIRQILDKMLSQKVIRESTSPWSSPVVLVKKKDSSLRMCVDYRRVNMVVRNNAHPLPHIEATLQSLIGKKVFSTLDCLAGYWQLPLSEKSKEITAFAIGSELYEWNVLPFGLVTSPALFQAAMENIVGDLLGKCAFVYVDDLLVASESIEQHVEDLKLILAKVQSSGMCLRAKKCRIAQKEVEYLGHKITPEGVKTDELKVEKMKNFNRPTNVKELQSFLGLVGYYRKFILNFSQIASPLTPLISPKTAWVWDAEQETAFQKLISAMCSTPVLRQPDADAAINGNRPFLIYTDASRKGVGAVLAQENEEGQQHPIAFMSKSLSPAESRYHITDLEALAMMHALRRFKVIVYGTPVIVFTDHKPLVYLLKGSALADRLLRWSIELLEYNVKIVYVAGKANAVADALSRGGCPVLTPQEMEETETIELSKIIAEIKENPTVVSSLETDKWIDLLKEEEGWKELIHLLENGATTGSVKIPGVKKEIQVEDYMLIGKSLRNVEVEECNRFVVPRKVCNELIEEAHSGQFSGHFGTEKMMRQLSKRFYFPKMRALIESVVKSCTKCLCVNDHPKLVAPLKPYETSRPLEIVACDLIEVGLSTNGNKYLLTIIDLFTKFAQAIPIPDKKADTVLKAFVERWAMGEGRVPETLLTDQGKEFANEHFTKFAEILGMQHVMTKGYNSRANGAIERFNKTIMHIIAKKAAVPMEWDEQVPFAVFAYNSMAHITTGESPMFLMTGRDAKGPLKIPDDGAVGISYTNVDEYKYLMVQELNKAHKMARESAEKEWERNKKLFDLKHNTETRKYPQPGSRVLVEIPAEKLGARCPKLVNKWKGTYRVISCSENSATVIPLLGTKKDTLVIPFDNLRVLPSVMEDTLIETVKGRAKARVANVEKIGIQSIQNSNNKNINLCSTMYTCKCPTPCLFWPPQHSALKTTSPSQLSRMMNVMKKYTKFQNAEYHKELLLMTQAPIYGISSLPSRDALRVMSSCSSLALVCQELEGWEKEYVAVRDDLLKEHFGCDLLKSTDYQVIVMEGVPRESVKFERAKIHWLSSANHCAEVSAICGSEQAKIVLLITPVSIEQSELDHWNSLIKEIPASMEIVVVPTHMTNVNYDWMQLFVPLMKGIVREEGTLFVLFPDEKTGHLNRPLHTFSEFCTPSEYWKTVLHLLEMSNHEIPGLKSLPEKTVDPNMPSTSGSRSVANIQFKENGGAHHAKKDKEDRRMMPKSSIQGKSRVQPYHFKPKARPNPRD